MTNHNKLILILDNVRSAHNVGAIWRSASAFGVDSLAIVGVTPHPSTASDHRLPHVQNKDASRIAKTALGAEMQVPFKYFTDIKSAIAYYSNIGFKIYALEQDSNSNNIIQFKPSFPCVLIVGNEVRGLGPETLSQAEAILEIPMQGSKKSLNVSVAAGVAMYQLSNQRTSS